MNLLVLVQNYPDESDNQRFAYVHTRNKYYAAMGIKVLVLAFDAKKEYVFENINITTEKLFKKKCNAQTFDAVISHAPNWRNHFRLLYFNKISIKTFFFIHGHEVLKQSNYYPDSFSKFRTKLFFTKKIIANIYDDLKLIALRKYFNNRLNNGQTKIIFVSEWMKIEFQKNIHVSPKLLEDNSIIIPNAAGKEFIENKYDYLASEKIKIITIRQFDNPKYAVDLVLKAAFDNPDIEFHLFGTGKFFNYFNAPNNLKLFNKFFSHNELPKILNQYTAAFMPTRLDSQGVMMCEMATYGIPLITSDLEICHEMLKEFSNVFYISNDSKNIKLDYMIKKINLASPFNKEKFSLENTILTEIKYLYRAINGSEFDFKVGQID